MEGAELGQPEPAAGAISPRPGWRTTSGIGGVLHELIDTEPPYEEYRAEYGELAELGILKGQPFEPDPRMARTSSTRAAQGGTPRCGCNRSRTAAPPGWCGRGPGGSGRSYGRRTVRLTPRVTTRLEARTEMVLPGPDRVSGYVRRDSGAGPLYGCARAITRRLSRRRPSYTLTVPLPVPAKLFWSITVYDAGPAERDRHRQDHAALRSMVELGRGRPNPAVDLYFGRTAPDGTPPAAGSRPSPIAGWFVYFPHLRAEGPAFDGCWRLPDFQPV